MAEEKTNIEATPQTNEQGTSNAEVGNVTPVFTEEQQKVMQEQMDALANKMYSQGAKKTQEEYEKKMADLNRQKELEAMNDKERFEAERKDFQEKQQSYAQDRAKFNALQNLSDEGLGKEFVNFVADLDDEKMISNVNSLKELIAGQVSKGIESGLAGSPKQVIANKTEPKQNNGWNPSVNKEPWAQK